MIKTRSSLLSALLAVTVFAALPARADNMASIAITPASGVVTLTSRWATGPNLAGFHLMAQDLSLGGGANQFYSIKGTAIPSGGDVSAFTRYIAASGAATDHADIGSKLTPTSYSALTSADPDIGYGAVNFYLIHRKSSGDYFSVIKPSSALASAVTDLKPMSGPGGPATLGASGYFGLTFAAANLGYGLNLFYYLRTDAVTGFTKFGTLEPALLGTSADKFDLGIGGYNALAFTGTDVGFGTDKMYYLRLDPLTGFTIFGTLHPLTGRAADIANLGSVFSALTFVPGDVGFGSGRFYTTGSVNPTWQSISFAAIADRAISAGSFTVSPSASSGLPIALTVAAGSSGSASISSAVAGVFTVTPTSPGVITLQAKQAGQVSPVAYESNMLRQSFTATGTATLVITTQPIAQSFIAGSTASFSVAASGTTTVSYQWRKAGAAITGNASAATATLSLPNLQATDGSSYDVVVTNASGSIPSDSVVLTVTSASSGAPVITNTSLSSPGTIGTAFTYTITASGTPTSYGATGLPAGLTLNPATGAITGTPTTAGTSTVTLTATNAAGSSSNTTLTITVALGTVAPVITSPSTAPGTVGTPFAGYTIAGTGSPTSFTATGLPAGLTLNTATGAITGTPTTAGSSAVTVTATNSFGTTTSTVTITVAGLPAGASSRIVAFSARAMSGPGSQTLIMGFIVSGDGKTLLVRGIGPTLASYGILTPLADPMLTLFSSSTTIASNDDWQTNTMGLPNGALLASIATQVGAAPLPSGSKDSAMLFTFNNGAHTTSMLRPNSTPGIALTEIYDTDLTSSSRLIAVSARMNVTAGEGTLIAGLVIAGNAPKTVLVRGIGPSLATYGVTGVLADPKLSVFAGGVLIATNDNWETGSSTAAQIAATAARVGEFPLPSGSKDASMILTLQPGVYTVHVTSVDGSTGVALVEIYETD